MDLKTLFLDQLLGGKSESQSPAPLPDDPMNEATPPHLRQFYGQEGNYGQPPEDTLKAPDPGMMEKALKAAEDAFNATMQGAGDMGRGVMRHFEGPPELQRPQPGQSSEYPAPHRMPTIPDAPRRNI